MERRDFLIGSAAVVGSTLLACNSAAQGVGMADRTYRILGVPLRSGSLYPGNENDARAYRDAHLLDRLHTAGCKAFDEGDVAIPSYLPHHTVPPIRNWPGPRIAWECVSERIEPFLRQPGNIPLLIGCDCSVVVGSTQALMQVRGREVHVLYVDGDFDDAAPDASQGHSAASSGIWLLTHSSPFWAGPVLKPSQVSVIGWTKPAQSDGGVFSLSQKDLRQMGIQAAARKVLEGIPLSAEIVLHFDIDVMRQSDMPVAYFPHPEGLSLTETKTLLGCLLIDPRIRIIEVSEYATLRDLDGSYINKLIDILLDGMKR
jgi:arginase